MAARMSAPVRGRLVSWLAGVVLASASLAQPVFASQAPICRMDEIEIEVLPFHVTENFSTSYAKLEGVAYEVGLVRETTTVTVQGCKATVGYVDPVLYVASELRGNACAFETVLGHEERHLEIYRHALLNLELRIRATAANRPLFEAAVYEVNAVRALQNAFDDSESESRKNWTSCHGQIYKLALHVAS
jgi:hypothetical protein